MDFVQVHEYKVLKKFSFLNSPEVFSVYNDNTEKVPLYYTADKVNDDRMTDACRDSGHKRRQT